jgi:hypothetical protein
MKTRNRGWGLLLGLNSTLQVQFAMAQLIEHVQSVLGIWAVL